ncbi:MAG: ester cyclase [Chloroflexi bacterium]|nr:ester cyclase [Chloroflexota bacterium]
MPTQDNKTIAINFYKEQDRLKGKLSESLTAPSYTAIINGGAPITASGHEEMGAMFWAAFPDIEQTIEETVAEGNKVAVRFTMRATHTGEFFGTPATGKQVVVTGMGILRIVNGKVAEFREEFDVMGLMEQIGAIPTPGH